MDDFLNIQRELIANPHKDGLPRESQFWIDILQHPLRPIQDVKTRWDSTTQMCLRLRLLKRAVTIFLRKYQTRLLLSSDQWKQVEYLIKLTSVFNSVTQTIGRSQSPSIHEVYETYDTLLTHLDKEIQRLTHKSDSWKKSLRNSLEAAKEKLQSYFEKLGVDQSLEEAYAFSWLLHPAYRQNAFSMPIQDFRPNPRPNPRTNPRLNNKQHLVNRRREYMRRLRRLWEEKYRERSQVDDQSKALQVQRRPIDLIRNLTSSPKKNRTLTENSQNSGQKETDELDRYFEQGRF
jgi:hypothetical protein